MNLGGEAGERSQQLGEAQVVAAGQALGVVAAERGHAGHEGVRDELVHRLHALGHRPARRRGPAAAARRPPPAGPAGKPGPRAKLRLLRRRLGARARAAAPPVTAALRARRGASRPTHEADARPAPGTPSDRRASVTARPGPPC